MKINIDTDKLKKRDVSVNEFLTLLSIYNRQNGRELDYIDRKQDYLSLSSKGYISIDGATVLLLPRSLYLIEGIGRDYAQLANDIKEVFPKGLKDGKYPWRGTVKIIADKLRKLDRSHGLDDYQNEEIIDVCRKYVDQFNSMTMDRGMQIAPYFVEKEGNSTLMAWLEREEEDIKPSNSLEIKL